MPEISKAFQKIEIDPDSATEGRTLSSFLSTVSFIPLETTDESIFSSISQLEVTQKTYIIWDKTSNSILIFLKNGKFLKKITNRDKTLRIPFKMISNFYVNESRGELVFSDSYQALTYIFSLDGAFLKILKTPLYQGAGYTGIGDYNLYFQNYFNPGHGIPTKNLIITNNGQLSKSYLSFDTLAIDDNDVYYVGKSFYNSQNGVTYFTRAYDYNVYGIDSSANVSVNFSLVLPPVQTIPEDFMTSDTYRRKRTKYISTNVPVIYAITDFYKHGDNVIFTLIGYFRNETLIYNLKTKKLTTFKSYISDDVSHMLPMTFGNVHGIDKDGKFISSVTAVSLFQSKLDLGKDGKNDNYLPGSLKDFFKSNNLQNPVLTLFSVK